MPRHSRFALSSIEIHRLCSMLQALTLHLYEACSGGNDAIHSLLWVWALLPLILYYCWRQWCFTLSPWLYPQQVVEIPYRIPREQVLDQ